MDLAGKEEQRVCDTVYLMRTRALDVHRECIRGYREEEGYYGAKNLAHYLFTWKRVLPFWMKSTICLAAAMPALMFASAVCAPIFFGVAK